MRGENFLRPMALAIPLAIGACTSDAPRLAPPSAEQPWPIFAPTVEIAREPEDRADADPSKEYGLDELIDLAQRRNPETRAAWERARQAALAVGLTEASYLPQLTAEVLAGYQHTPLPIPPSLLPQGYFTANTEELLPTLSVKWLLFDFGRRDGAQESARANSFVANVAFTGAHQKLIFAVSRDYYALDAARGRLRVAEQSLKNAGIVEDAVRLRRARGLATLVDVAQAERRVAEARYALVGAEGSERAAYQALVASIGAGSAFSPRVADGSAISLPPAPGEPVDHFVHQALAQRPDLLAAEGKIRAAEANLRKEDADDYPTVALVAQGYQNLGGLSVEGSPYYTVNQPGGNIGLVVSWSLYDGGMRSAKAAIARSQVAEARDSLDQARDQAARQVIDSYDSLKTGLAGYQAAVTLKAAAQLAYDASLDAYRHGVGTYLDLIQNETALTQARSEFETSRATSLSAARALAFSTGTISK